TRLSIFCGKISSFGFLYRSAFVVGRQVAAFSRSHGRPLPAGVFAKSSVTLVTQSARDRALGQ
ncbi:MAG TPA: hypothetical protein VNN13_06300, partial [Methylomirabilota bacterium]|nr:hypothetical protein [Methylomirabilota bacterium]